MRVVETDWVVFVEAAVAGDASCKIWLGVAFTFSQSDVKSPAVAGVGGSEHAFLLVSSNAFHCDIVINGLAFSLSFPSLFACCSSFGLLLNRLVQAS